MENQDLDLDNLDTLFEQFDGVVVENGVDVAAQEDDCAGGACKI